MKIFSLLFFLSISLLYAQKADIQSVTRLYIATFDRVPDYEGLRYWLDDSGLKLEGIASSFFEQEETMERYPPDSDDEEFVRAVYENLFDREPESAGLEYWLQRLRSGEIEKSLFLLAVINGAQGDDAKILDGKTGKALEELSYSHSRMHLLIPLYSYPEIQSDNFIWQRAIDIKKAHPLVDITVIVNQSNGDFDRQSSSYAKAIPMLREAGIRVIGYVYTSYGRRDAERIRENISAWKKFYGEAGVEGIFFDEVSTKKENLQYYETLCRYARSEGLEFIVLNPGTAIDEAYLDSGMADVVVWYENPYENFTEEAPSTPPARSEDDTALGILIYRMDSGEVGELFDFARRHDLEYIYFTEDGFDGNPWDSLSIHSEELVELIESSARTKEE